MRGEIEVEGGGRQNETLCEESLKRISKTSLLLRSQFPILTLLSIPVHRQAIDKLDEQLVRLLNDRTRHVRNIGHYRHACFHRLKRRYCWHDCGRSQ